MNSIYKKIIGAIVALLALFGVYSGAHVANVGGVSQGNEYSYATTTGSFTVGTSTAIRIGYGTLGSLNIGTISAGVFKIKDATSPTDTGSTTLFEASGSQTGSYQFDVAFNRGLFLEIPTTFVGRYTITYR